jgi:hypothetical protein
MDCQLPIWRSIVPWRRREPLSPKIVSFRFMEGPKGLNLLVRFVKTV